MWIFTRSGFFSIVVDQERPDNLLVRARFKGDVEALFPGVEVQTTPATDYR